jgi:hypothetical protein
MIFVMYGPSDDHADGFERHYPEKGVMIDW